MADVLVEKAVNIHHVTNKTVAITRNEIIRWVASTTGRDIRRIEELSDGSTYCLLMNQLFPGSIPTSKIRYNARTEAESVANYKLLVNAFRELDVRKDIPMESLAKGVFSENFRFGQWFKLFYDANAFRAKYFKAVGASGCPQTSYVSCRPRRSASISSRHERAVEGNGGSISMDRDLRLPENSASCQSTNSPANDMQRNESESARQRNTGHSRTNSTKESALKLSQTKVINSSGVLSDESKFASYGRSESIPEGYCDGTTSKQRNLSQLQDASNTAGRFVPRTSQSRTIKSPVNCQSINRIQRCDSPLGFHHPQRRSFTDHSLLHRGDQLPPPSPYPSSHYSATSNRWMHKPTAGQNWTLSRLPANAMASGDRPVESINHDGSGGEKIRRYREMNSEDSKMRCFPSRTTHRNEECDNGELKCYSAAVTPEMVSNTSNLMLSTTPPVVRNRKLSTGSPITSSMNLANTGTQAHSAAHCLQHSIHPHDIQLEDLMPESSVKECMLLRQLSALRFRILEQRRALYFCQKEAEFYFNKLTKIEDFCYQLQGVSGRSRQNTLDNILGILYAEDEYVCSDVLED